MHEQNEPFGPRWRDIRATKTRNCYAFTAFPRLFRSLDVTMSAGEKTYERYGHEVDQRQAAQYGTGRGLDVPTAGTAALGLQKDFFVEHAGGRSFLLTGPGLRQA